MYLYKFISAFPEGANYTNSWYHKKCFTQKEFDNIIEGILITFCKTKPDDKHYEKFGFDFRISHESGEFVNKMLLEKGFIEAKEAAWYVIEPYWGKESITSDELRDLLPKKYKDIKEKG